MVIERKVSAALWPDVLIPEEGCFPPSRESKEERVLHVALRTSFEQQPGLARALASLGPYAEIDWMERERRKTFPQDLLALAEKHRPTLVFMQIQRKTSLTPMAISRLRRISAENVVIVNWDGDQHNQPTDPARAWFVELGRVCDTSLVCNTLHPRQYHALGVKHPGYLQIGIDDRFFPRNPPARVPDIVMLASSYPLMRAYSRRQEVVLTLAEKFGQRRFAVYGYSWEGLASGHPMIKQTDEAAVYLGAKAAVSMSICNDLPRYSSDRLFRGLAAGGVMLVEAFPDMEGLGLVDRENCFIWRTHDELLRLIDEACAVTDKNITLRKAASILATTIHTWAARMSELAAIVEAVRQCR